MKLLNITADGLITFLIDDIEGNIDTNHPELSAADVALFQAEIDTLQAHGLYEIHLEAGPLGSFVHKVGKDKFVSEDDPDAYEIFRIMHQWGPQVNEK